MGVDQAYKLCSRFLDDGCNGLMTSTLVFGSSTIPKLEQGMMEHCAWANWVIRRILRIHVAELYSTCGWIVLVDRWFSMHLKATLVHGSLDNFVTKEACTKQIPPVMGKPSKSRP